MKGGRDYSPSKLRELVIYVAERSAGDSRFGMTKLNKILFFSDFEAYLRTGRSITGAAYQHLDEGPAPHQMLPVLESLKRDSAVIEKREQTYGGAQRRIIATREADLSDFSGPEVAVINEVIDRLAPLTNFEARELSHLELAWRLTHDKQEIPYGTVYLASDPPSEEDAMWLEQVPVDGSLLSP
jgi:hypothetical protein